MKKERQLLSKLLCWSGCTPLLLLILLVILIALFIFRNALRLPLIILLALLCFVGLLCIVRLIVRILRELCARLKRKQDPGRGKMGPPAMLIPSHTYKRPDPLIYSQAFLMAQGAAVTWDNPDIYLADPKKENKVVPSSELIKATTYNVFAQVWNGSQEAPAVGVGVRFSFLTFGINTVKTFIGETTVDLPVKGASAKPSLATVQWTTPDKPGHYCLLVELVWPDDANPANNIGQENTNVKALNSPHAAFTFPVRNDFPRPRELRLEVDSYRLPPRRACPQRFVATSLDMTRRDVAMQRAELLSRHARVKFPVPPGWKILIEPQTLMLDAYEERMVTVDITAPDGFTGRQAFNVNAFHDEELLGGVTLYVEG